VLAIAILPLVDTRHGHAVLGRPNCRDITGRAGTNDYKVKTSAHLAFESLNL
jgi:hypothetical protein